MIDRDAYRTGLEELVKQLQRENDDLIRELREVKRQLEIARQENARRAKQNVE